MSIIAALPFIERAINRFFPDQEKAAEAMRDIEKTLVDNAAEINKLQIEVNREEAQHPSIFVSGWRPFVGWTCGVALAWHFVAAPFIIFALTYLGKPVPDLPVFEMDTLLTVLMGMLGLGGLRTFEKMKGVARK